MPGVSGRMIRRRLEKSESDRLARRSNSTQAYDSVSTKDLAVDCEKSPEVSSSRNGLKKTKLDLSAIWEDSQSPVTRMSPFRRALEYCKILKRSSA